MNTETFEQILMMIRAHKTCSDAQARRYIKRCKIKSVGILQRPLRYPEGSANRILKMLGFEPAPDRSCRIPSMKELRHERAKAIAARGTK